MKTFNTMEELYEALKPFEPDGAVYIYLSEHFVYFAKGKEESISEIRINYNSQLERYVYWKIPRPVDLTKYIGKVVKCETYPGKIYYRILCERDTDKSSIWKSIEPLTSEDIQ